jgi:hypothetical protein
MSSSIINDINSSSTLFINNVNNQAINIGTAGGLTTIVSGLTLSNTSTLNIGTTGSTTPANIYGLLTIQPTTGNTLTINSTATSATLASNSFYTSGGIGVSLASYFGSSLTTSGLIRANLGLNVATGQTLNVGTSGTTSPANVYGLIIGFNGITSTSAINNFGSTTFSASSTINMGGNVVNNVATPLVSSDIASKGYVDSVANGLSVKQSVQVATTVAGTITNYTISAISTGNGTQTITTNTTNLVTNQSVVITSSDSTPIIDGTYSITVLSNTQFTINTGINVTIAGSIGTVAVGINSSFSNGSVIDGYTLVTGNRILIKNQSNGIENGIYTVNVSGPPTRSNDLAFGVGASGVFTFTEEGTINTNDGFVCSNSSLIDIVGTNSLTFTQFSNGQLVAGTNINVSGNTISVVNNPSFSNGLTVTSGSSVSLQIPTTITTSSGTNLSISNTSTTSQNPLVIYQGSLTTSNNVTMNIGVSGSTNLSGIMQFNYLSSGTPANNTLQLGLQGQTGMTIDGNNNIVTNGTITNTISSGTNLSISNNNTGTEIPLSILQASLNTATTRILLGKSNATNNSGFITYTDTVNGASANNTISLNINGQTGMTVNGNNLLTVGSSTIGSIIIPNTTTNGTVLTINNTTDPTTGSTNTGSVVLAGGMGIGGKLNVSNDITSVGGNISASTGTITASGLLSGGSLQINGKNMTPSVNDIIEEVSFTNNTALPHATQNVTGLSVSSTTCRGFKAFVSISITCSSSGDNLYKLFELIGIYTNATSTWYFNPEILGGDVTNIVFTITSGGQIQYALSSIPAGTFSSLKIQFKVMSLTQ